jgi:diketogulonate reductase-like aldo/keto reductase
MSEQPYTAIAPGVDMPLVGLGTWEASGAEAHGAVLRALEIGCRLIDTATMYRNEAAVGQAVRESGLPRDELFITTKLPSGNAGRERETIDASLEAMHLEYVDLWLVHWPPGGRARPDVWEQFVEVRSDGLARAIGVSNYDPAQIDEIVAATGVSPAVNQIRWSPALYDPALEQAHRERGVTLEGYSPFKTTNLRAPALVEIADAHGVSTRQVVVRWHVEHGFVVIPKSSDPARIAANFDVFGFTLDADEIARIDRIGETG